MATQASVYLNELTSMRHFCVLCILVYVESALTVIRFALYRARCHAKEQPHEIGGHVIQFKLK
jgi:hypothetical protein